MRSDQREEKISSRVYANTDIFNRVNHGTNGFPRRIGFDFRTLDEEKRSKRKRKCYKNR